MAFLYLLQPRRELGRRRVDQHVHTTQVKLALFQTVLDGRAPAGDVVDQHVQVRREFLKLVPEGAARRHTRIQQGTAISAQAEGARANGSI